MNHHLSQTIFFGVLLFITAALGFLVFLPYFGPIFLAIVLAVLLTPVYRWFRRLVWDSDNLAAVITTVLTLLIIIIPLIFFSFLLFGEISEISNSALQSGHALDGLGRVLGSLESKIVGVIPESQEFINNYFNLEQWLTQLLGWFTGNLQNFFSKALHLLVSVVIMVLGLFYFLRDGEEVLKELAGLSPLAAKHTKEIFNKIQLAIEAVVRGKLVIAIIQGIFVAVGFSIFGISNPVLWGSIAAVASLVPTVGTALVLVPTVLILFIAGAFGQALGIAIWGAVAVGLIDDFLGPILIERRIKIHPFMILVSILGGIWLFGPIGFIAGPVLISLLVSLLEMYPKIVSGRSRVKSSSKSS